MRKRTISARLDSELLAHIDRQASAQGRTRTDMIESLLQYSLKEQKNIPYIAPPALVSAESMTPVVEAIRDVEKGLSDRFDSVVASSLQQVAREEERARQRLMEVEVVISRRIIDAEKGSEQRLRAVEAKLVKSVINAMAMAMAIHQVAKCYDKDLDEIRDIMRMAMEDGGSHSNTDTKF